MQAIILAAGKGRRIKSLTVDKPKCLLNLGRKTIVELQIELLRKNKIKKIIIIGGYYFQKIKDVLKTHKEIEFVFNPFYEETNVLTSMWFGKDLLKEDYIFLHGDTVFEEGILRNLIDAKGDMVLAVDFKKCERENMKVKIKGNRIIEISKGLPLKEADGEFIGIAKITRPIMRVLHNAVDSFMVDKQFDCFFESAIQKVIDDFSAKYGICCVDISGHFWEEIDFKEDYIRAKNYYEKESL